MNNWNRDDAIKCQIDLMEKEIVYLKGWKREKARIAYLKLLLSCGTPCGLEEPIFPKRT
jgi:hypothetical protein